MKEIILTTFNSRYTHSSLGLRYLFANLEELQERAQILEFVINSQVADAAEEILAKNPKIVKTDNPSFELQTILLIEGMPKWTPAKQNGKDVNCYVTLPIKYGQ